MLVKRSLHTAKKGSLNPLLHHFHTSSDPTIMQALGGTSLTFSCYPKQHETGRYYFIKYTMLNKYLPERDSPDHKVEFP